MAVIRNIFGGKRGTQSFDVCTCDECGVEYTQKTCITKTRRNGKIANGRDLCSICTQRMAHEKLALVGTLALKSIPPERKREICSAAGKLSAKNFDPLKPHSRFTTERWESMSTEDQRTQVIRANAALQEKLKDPEYAEAHWKKIFQQLRIGYVSKGHLEVHDAIKHMGFNTHVLIGSMQVDECNENLKIVIEYNGDYWHCNPKKWKAEEYNSAIKMTAGEKWKADIARHAALRKMGYTTITIWESGWEADRQKYINRVEEVYHEASRKKEHTD